MGAIGKNPGIFTEIDRFLPDSLKDRIKMRLSISLSKKYQDTASRTSKLFQCSACVLFLSFDLFAAGSCVRRFI
jgi:hypothetical protein